MSRRATSAILTVVTLVCLAACAGPPSKGPIRLATLNQDQNQINITAKGPYDGILPRAVVTGFLAATAGDDGDSAFQVAQQFMADGVGKAWIGDKRIAAGYTLVYAESQPRLTPPTPIISPDGTAAAAASDSSGGVGQTTSITATVTKIAELRDGGFYHPTAVTPMQVTFRLGTVKVGAGVQWRITEPPTGPDGTPARLISIADLRRAYQALPVFEPVAGGASLATATVNQIYVMSSDATRTYEALVRALLGGSASSDPVQVGFDQTKVRVVLGALPKSATGRPAWSSGTLADAIVATFQAAAPYLQLSGNTPPYTALALRIGQTETTTQILPPSSVRYPTVYFAVGGSVKAVDGPASESTPSPAKTVLDGGALPSRSFDKIAVRQEKVSGGDGSQSSDTAPIRVAALVTKGTGVGDIAVYANLDPSRNNAGLKPVVWYHATDPRQVTDLTWDPVDGSLWIVDGGELFNVSAPQNGVTQAPIMVPKVVPSAPYQRIRLSPDGQQAVVVTGSDVDKASSDSATTALLANIVRPDTRAPAGTGLNVFQLTAQYGIQPTPVGDTTGKQRHISDVAWAGGRTIVLLAKEQGSGQGAAPPKLYKVYVDGSQDAHLADSVEQSEGPATTRIAAVVSDAGSSQMRIFSDGTKVDDPTPAIYWKGKTFDFFDVGDNPVMATRMVAGS